MMPSGDVVDFAKTTQSALDDSASDLDVDHYYVFSRKHFGLCYERTVGSEADAVQRVQEIQARGRKAMFFKNELPKERWFY